MESLLELGGFETSEPRQLERFLAFGGHVDFSGEARPPQLRKRPRSRKTLHIIANAYLAFFA
jgi:hypothetical protein